MTIWVLYDDPSVCLKQLIVGFFANKLECTVYFLTKDEELPALEY